MVWEGYILYLKKWSQKSLEPNAEQLPEVDKVHSDVQRLILRGSLGKDRESLEVTNSAVEDKPLKHELASHQKKLTKNCNQDVTMGI